MTLSECRNAAEKSNKKISTFYLIGYDKADRFYVQFTRESSKRLSVICFQAIYNEKTNQFRQFTYEIKRGGFITFNELLSLGFTATTDKWFLPSAFGSNDEYDEELFQNLIIKDYNKTYSKFDLNITEQKEIII